jgi:hypothetical protein
MLARIEAQLKEIQDTVKTIKGLASLLFVFLLMSLLSLFFFDRVRRFTFLYFLRL